MLTIASNALGMSALYCVNPLDRPCRTTNTTSLYLQAGHVLAIGRSCLSAGRVCGRRPKASREPGVRGDYNGPFPTAITGRGSDLYRRGIDFRAA